MYPMDSVFVLLALAAFVLFFAGYASGRRSGRDEGFFLGLTYGPLEMRRQMLLDDHCTLCGTGSHHDGADYGGTDVTASD